VIEGLERFAAARGLSLLAVAIGGLAAQPAVTSVIAGATRPEQLKANARAAAWEPSADDLRDLDAIAPPPDRAPETATPRRDPARPRRACRHRGKTLPVAAAKRACGRTRAADESGPKAHGRLPRR
jgi:hypothetical protein